jgi:hypothetical protein
VTGKSGEADGRFVLLLDILGFKNLVRSAPVETILESVRRILEECDEWASGRNEFGFDAIHYSDTLLIYTQEPGFDATWFDDLIFIGSRLCCSMFAARIPVRAAMSYGPFVVERIGRHRAFVGEGLVDAYEAESGPVMGLKVTSSTLHRALPGVRTAELLKETSEGLVQPDGTLLMNFLTEFIGEDKRQVAFDVKREFTHPEESDNPWLLTELTAFRFILENADAYVRRGERDAIGDKYVKTMDFIREVLGPELYGLAEELSDAFDERDARLM